MRVVLATPLYPPDIAPPAPYIKELARRLAGRHQVTVVAYGRLPEVVPGVRIISIDKRAPLPVRLYRYALALRAAAQDAEVVYAANGASVELPLLICGKRYVLALADVAAHERASLPLHIMERIAATHAEHVVSTLPLPRPEIIPLDPEPTEALAAYEASWQRHLEELERLFNHG